MLTSETDISAALAQRGISRRQLVKFCSVMLGTLALPERYLAQTVAAVSKTKKPVLLWLQFQDCAGCSESMLRSGHPSVADVVLELLSWEYHEVIMAGSGKSAEAVLDRVVKDDQGKYLAVVEGAIPTAEGGVHCTVGGRTAMDIAERVCRNAAATRPGDVQLAAAQPHPHAPGGVIPRIVSMPNLRLIHFFLMFVFIAFGVFHVHLAMLISREEKRGLMDSIFIGYKVIPVKELEAEEEKAGSERA